MSRSPSRSGGSASPSSGDARASDSSSGSDSEAEEQARGRVGSRLPSARRAPSPVASRLDGGLFPSLYERNERVRARLDALPVAELPALVRSRSVDDPVAYLNVHVEATTPASVPRPLPAELLVQRCSDVARRPPDDHLLRILRMAIAAEHAREAARAAARDAWYTR